MNLGRIIPKANTYPHNMHRMRSNFTHLETGKGSFWKTHDLNGDELFEFYVLLIDLFDRAIVNNDLHSLSLEQENLWRKYVASGHTLTNPLSITEAELMANVWDVLDGQYVLGYSPAYQALYDKLGTMLETLDDFLGSYIGEDDGRYSRYKQEQLHCKHQPFSYQATNHTGNQL